MSVFIDIKTGEKVVIIELINNTFGCFARVRRLRDKKTYVLPYAELKPAN